MFLIRDIGYQSINLSGCFSSDTSLEIQGIRTTWRGKPLNILNMYHPPDTKNLLDELQDLFNANTICIGDLNAKYQVWGSKSSILRGNDLINLIDDAGFIVLNDGTPTHISYSYDSREALDLSFVSSDLGPSCTWKVLENIGSDHLPILLELKRRQPVHMNSNKHWNFRRANWQSFTNLVEKKINSIPFSDDLDTNWQTLKRIIIKSASLCIPRGNFLKRKPYLTSKTPSLQPLLEERRALMAEVVSGNSVRSKLNKINAQLNLTYTKIKRDKWKELCTELDSRSSDSKLWRLVRGIGKEQQQIEDCNTILDTDGSLAQNDEHAANILGKHYQNISKLNFSRDDKFVKKIASNIVRDCRSSLKRESSIFNKVFSIEELDVAITNLNPKKSPGPDGIHAHMLLNLGLTGKQRFLDVINLSWEQGRLPREWKRAVVIPVKGPGKKSASPESYRPIALTNLACKVMEKMIQKRLIYHLNSKNLLPIEQYGFREGHSTTDQVLYFCQKIRDAHNRKPTHHTIAAFLDLSKAFDRVWNQKLIIKLFDNFGINGRALTWIYDFLRNRVIRVKFNNSSSKSFKLHQGVPQGSVLSPTLFLLFLKGIEGVIPENCEIGLFADDIVLWESGTDLQKLEDNINLALTELWTFAEKHKMCFNPTKSTVGFFTTNRSLYKYQPNILLNNQPLTVEKHPKYLGFVLDPEIRSNKHIDHLVLKARKRLNILKYISGRDWGADANILRTTFNTLIRPILEYGFQIYCCASDTNLQKLERIQLAAARIITGLRNSCPREIVLYEADLQPLCLRRSAGITKYYNKLHSLGSQNRTSEFVRNWHSNQRLKRNSPFSQASLTDLFTTPVDQHYLKQCIDPSEGLPNVSFHTELSINVNKQNDHPDLLRQVALERISNIPADAALIYTDGSKNEANCAGSGIFIKAQGQEIRIQKKNPDFCSVFRSELIAIDEGLDRILSFPQRSEIWILSDSKSAIQHLANFHNVRDYTGTNILKKLKYLSLSHQIHLQWIPSHVNIIGNEIADTLAKKGADEALAPVAPLTFSELFSIAKQKIKADWLQPPVHNWYRSQKPGGCLSINSNREDQTALTRFRSGHLKHLKYSGGIKCYHPCINCSCSQASPEHILNCIGLSDQDLFDRPYDTIMDLLRVKGFMDLI